MKNNTSLKIACLFVAACLQACGGGEPDSSEIKISHLKLLGTASLPTGTMFRNTEFGGISGLDIANDGSYWAISDERGGERGTPRFYNLSIDYDEQGKVDIKINSQIFMRLEDGSTFSSTSKTVDPEAIRLAPNGNLYWSSEGIWSTNPDQLHQPFLREMKVDGSFVGQFETPDMYNYINNSTHGGINNKLFEALAITPKGRIFIGNEDALAQDGPITSVENGSVIRITEMDSVSKKPLGQYAYVLPAIPVDAPPTARFPPDLGLSDMIAISENKFIMVERAFADGIGNTINLVVAEITNETTNVLNLSSLKGAAYTPMTKKTLLEMPIYHEGIKLDNMEAISWGKNLANGNRTLILASDNNFKKDVQSNLFMVFEVIEE